jgi:hypothetical protein
VNNREHLEIWLRAVLTDSRTDVEDKVVLGDKLDRLGVLPSELWMSVDTYRLDDEQAAALTAAVRAVIERNPVSEALHNWEQFHGLRFGDN